MSSTNWSRNLPLMISSQAAMIASILSLGRTPNSLFARAAAFLTLAPRSIHCLESRDRRLSRVLYVRLPLGLTIAWQKQAEHKFWLLFYKMALWKTSQ